MLAKFGRYVEIGNINAGKTFEFGPSRFVLSNKTMVGVCLYNPAVLSRELTFLEHHQDRLPLDRLSAARYSLDDINGAFAAADGKHDVRASIVPDNDSCARLPQDDLLALKSLPIAFPRE